jgi:hypothetical protein
MKRITVTLCIAAAALCSAGAATSANDPAPRGWSAVQPNPRWFAVQPAAIRYGLDQLAPIRFGVVKPNPRSWGWRYAHQARMS